MKSLPFAAAFLALAAACSTSVTPPEAPASLKDALADDFLIGAALDTSLVAGLRPGADSITRLHFNSIVAENCMKSAEINPAQGVYLWAPADSFVAYGERNGMAVIGHTLVWHSQLAPWFAVDAEGREVSADTLRERMRSHIHAMVGRYKGRVKGWDVVNEAILDDGSYRDTPFYRILGEEYIPLAFQFAHEADPEAELYLNDYAMANPRKRDAYVRLARSLKERGLRIDGIGMQGHNGMDYPDYAAFEASIDSFAAAGVNVMITEWDQTVLPTVNTGANVADKTEYAASLNPYPDGMPDSVAAAWNARALEFFNMLRRHSDVITRVTVWGTDDGQSWRNDWPVKGRTDYPLLFSRDFSPKPVVDSLLSSSSSISITSQK